MTDFASSLGQSFFWWIAGLWALSFAAWGREKYQSIVDPSRPSFTPGLGFLNRRRK
ncbi:hypothetical protein HY995_02510 [Candidatus Micrarchaeota archaeon]|nr:hypothetical protein [Candidatus Micrarchaeota archaeon]